MIVVVMMVLKCDFLVLKLNHYRLIDNYLLLLRILRIPRCIVIFKTLGVACWTSILVLLGLWWGSGIYCFIERLVKAFKISSRVSRILLIVTTHVDIYFLWFTWVRLIFFYSCSHKLLIVILRFMRVLWANTSNILWWRYFKRNYRRSFGYLQVRQDVILNLIGN